ncbi:complement C1q-like protein 2 [Symphorus nematophorus]
MKIAAVFLSLQLVCFVSTSKTNADQQPCLQDVHAVLRKLSVALAEQKEQMKNLQRQHEGQAAKLRELERQKAEVGKLKQQLRVKQVAFSASLSARGHVDRGPFNKFTTLVFKGVVTNIGNAYNPHTGVFTAPVRGAYHFEWHIAAVGHTVTGAVLVKNSHRIFLAYEHQNGHLTSSSNGATLLLQRGDTVLLHLWVHTRVFDNDNHHSSFSGHLLFPL